MVDMGRWRYASRAELLHLPDYCIERQVRGGQRRQGLRLIDPCGPFFRVPRAGKSLTPGISAKQSPRSRVYWQTVPGMANTSRVIVLLWVAPSTV